MDLPINKNQPQIMHIDLDSCFATIEQQANPLLRGKPIAVAAHNSPNGCILASSIEAKKLGIKTGMRIKEARLIYPYIIIRTPDPEKYRDVHVKFKKIFSDYSNKITPKSIDEAIIDLHDMAQFNLDLVKIGREIKQRMRTEIGEWISCSIGISTNRFLAKLAATIHKPDGLDVITHKNLTAIYSKIELLDLHGINVRYQARLNAYGIFTPMDFLRTASNTLEKKVFMSICGRQWYERIRGYEVDDIDFGTKSIGQQYALKIPTANPAELAPMMMKLCEKMGRRLRRKGHTARGVHVRMNYKDGTAWHRGRITNSELYTTAQLYKHALLIFNQQPEIKQVTLLAVNCYKLEASTKSQMSLFDANQTKHRKTSDAMDEINDRWGEFTVKSGLMLGTENIIPDSIAFGRVKELENLE